jgi:hypothetical protein
MGSTMRPTWRLLGSGGREATADHRVAVPGCRGNPPEGRVRTKRRDFRLVALGVSVHHPSMRARPGSFAHRGDESGASHG